MVVVETRIVGVSDAELAALVAGRWVDDETSSPGWERWVMVEDDDTLPRIRQAVFPSSTQIKWNADSNDEDVWVDSLESALNWCDDRAGNIEPSEGTATRQKDRFADWGISRFETF